MSEGINDILINKEFLNIKNIIAKSGFRVTKQRELILNEFFLTHKHLSVDEIHDRLKGTNIGLATVYRNVKIFRDIGIIKEIVVDGVSYYELKIYSKKPLHIHFKCIKCHDIIDIDDKDIALEYLKLNKTIEDKNEIEVYDLDIMLVGLCKKCREVDKCQGQ